jgi:hypothetical protein
MNSLAFLLQAAMNCSIFSTSSFALRKEFRPIARCVMTRTPPVQHYVQVEIRKHVLIDVAQAAPISERQGRVLAPLVGMMNSSLRLTMLHRHVQRPLYQFDSQIDGECPTCYPTTPRVQNDCA